MQIIPVVTGMYLLHSLDRGNIGNARVAGLQDDLGMSDLQYSLALTATLIPYLIVEIPSNLFVTRFGAHIVLPSLIVVWGAVTAFQGIVTSYGGLIVCRVFLGICEGGLLPGISIYIAAFYPRNKLQFRVALFFASSALAGAFSGLLASAIEHLDGRDGRPGWAYIFILEGCLTVFYGILSFFIMPRSLETIKFLTAQEKEDAYSVLLQEQTLLQKDPPFNWKSTMSVLVTPHAWLTLLMSFMGGTFCLDFEPSIVQSLGFKANRAQLMSVPPFAAAWAVSIITAVFSDRFRVRGITIIFHSLVAMIGFVFLGSQSHSVQYGSTFFFVTGVFCVPPSLLSWIVNNAAPSYRRSAAVAFSLSTTSVGGILSTWLFGALSGGANFRVATIVSIVFSGASAVAAALNILWLNSQNQKRRKVQNPGPVVDDTSDGFIYML
ncbi:MFS general substrate transporter [Dendrothele bispora CBS 962.96]|uniref:MFS general substrate transporter n=1 Tax=Dendrothele bispora (strain CBS 962.96) TaxID=1314807 RepID=A0A4S8MTG7_DENBC|nr:MFS general substrate transporter [Dendrothele bispora CBS 962.96]